MDKKHWQISAWVGAIIIIVALVWSIKNNQTDREDKNSPAKTQNTQTTQEQTTSPVQTTSDVWVGILQASDNADKGNLLLTTSERTIYIRTNRDYSALVGKKVTVSYEGSWQNFVLGDITLAEQD